MPYDKKTGRWLSVEEREQQKKEQKKANKLAWKEHNKEIKALEPVSTPVGMKERMQEFKQKLLNAKTGDSIIRKTIEIALNDEHPHQGVCLKMCMDRMLPTSLFDEKKGEGRAVVNITISGLNDEKTIEGETFEVSEH